MSVARSSSSPGGGGYHFLCVEYLGLKLLFAHENFHTCQIEFSASVTAIISSISLEVAEILSFFSHFSVTPEIGKKTVSHKRPHG